VSTYTTKGNQGYQQFRFCLRSYRFRQHYRPNVWIITIIIIKLNKRLKQTHKYHQTVQAGAEAMLYTCI